MIKFIDGRLFSKVESTPLEVEYDNLVGMTLPSKICSQVELMRSEIILSLFLIAISCRKQTKQALILNISDIEQQIQEKLHLFPYSKDLDFLFEDYTLNTVMNMLFMEDILLLKSVLEFINSVYIIKDRFIPLLTHVPSIIQLMSYTCKEKKIVLYVANIFSQLLKMIQDCDQSEEESKQLLLLFRNIYPVYVLDYLRDESPQVSQKILSGEEIRVPSLIWTKKSFGVLRTALDLFYQSSQVQFELEMKKGSDSRSQVSCLDTKIIEISYPRVEGVIFYKGVFLEEFIKNPGQIIHTFSKRDIDNLSNLLKEEYSSQELLLNNTRLTFLKEIEQVVVSIFKILDVNDNRLDSLTVIEYIPEYYSRFVNYWIEISRRLQYRDVDAYGVCVRILSTLTDLLIDNFGQFSISEGILGLICESMVLLVSNIVKERSPFSVQSSNLGDLVLLSKIMELESKFLVSENGQGLILTQLVDY